MVWVRRPDPETIAVRSPVAQTRFLERQIKREKKSYFLAYIFLLFLGGLGAHRLYIRHYLIAPVLAAVTLIWPVFALFAPNFAGYWGIMLAAIFAFETLTLWLWVRRINHRNPGELRLYYAATEF